MTNCGARGAPEKRHRLPPAPITLQAHCAGAGMIQFPDKDRATLREIAVFKSFDPGGYVANSPMAWDVRVHKGHIFFSDWNSGLWCVKLVPDTRRRR